MEHMEHVEHSAHDAAPHAGHHEQAAAPASSHTAHGAGGQSGPAAHTGHMGNLKHRFFICLAAAVPVIVLSPMMGVSLPFQFIFPGSQWVVLALSSFLYFYGGAPFLSGAKRELLEKRPAMMTLISLGITASYLYSLYAFAQNTFSHGPHVMDFFWELATLIVIMLLGHWMEMRAVAGAGDALGKLAGLLPADASVRQPDGSFAPVPLRELRVGQDVMVKPGESVPADGVVLEGSTGVNESMVTGEAREVDKKPGDKVIGGSRNGAGGVLVRVIGTGESGYLARVMQLVGSARREKSRAETLSDKVARLLFFAAVAAGLAAFAVWLAISGSFGTAVMRMVTVVVIACPHALGLAVPLVVARSTSLGAQNGLLVRDRKALETAPKVNVVLMDKTGTLTEGSFRVAEIAVPDGRHTENDILALAAALETASSHPLAAGILNEASARGVKPVKVEAVQNLPGLGLAGALPDGRSVLIVGVSYLDKNGIPFDAQHYGELAARGYSVSFLLLDGVPAGLIAQGDALRSEAKHLVESLVRRGITPVMLTGDNPAAAGKIAALAGLRDYRAGLLPEDKEQVVQQYRSAGSVAMMVGDGVNDAPSLVRADVGVAIGAGTDIAIDSADVVLVKSDPADILHFLTLAKNTSRKMVQNLWWGAGYNIVAIPLAAGVLAPVGIVLDPAAGALLMSLSTIVVAVNAMTLRLNKGGE